MQKDLDYLGHLASESARFADAIRLAPPAARVPSCPDWTADDLLWHLAEVQFFWGRAQAGRRQVPWKVTPVLTGRCAVNSGPAAGLRASSTTASVACRCGS